jgi:hypothetical protein
MLLFLNNAAKVTGGSDKGMSTVKRENEKK